MRRLRRERRRGDPSRERRTVPLPQGMEHPRAGLSKVVGGGDRGPHDAMCHFHEGRSDGFLSVHDGPSFWRGCCRMGACFREWPFPHNIPAPTGSHDDEVHVPAHHDLPPEPGPVDVDPCLREMMGQDHLRHIGLYRHIDAILG